MLQKARKSFFNNNNITILNNKLATIISIYNIDEQVIII